MCSYTRAILLGLLSVTGWLQLCYGAVPQFNLPSSDGSSTVSVDESTATGTSIYTVSATDTGMGTITYSITSQSPSTKFQLISETISTIAALDYESSETSYTLQIQAVTTSTSDTAVATLVVNIADINDETPVITGTFTESVDEEVAVGTVAAGPFTITDADVGDTFSYSLSGSTKFQIDSSTREIKTAQVIDFEAGTTTFSLTLTVSDSASTPHSTSQAITITLNNVNDNTPVFSTTAYFVSVAENSATGTSVAQLTVTDGDLSDTVTLAIQNGDDGTSKFNLNNQLIETTANAIDYDVLSGKNFMYTLTVTGTDGTKTGTTSVYVSVTGLNEDAPVWGSFTPIYTSATTPYAISENSAVGTTIVTVAASDADAGTDGDILYTLISITPSGGAGATTGLFNLDRVTGVLTTTSNTLDRDTATGGVEYYDVVVRASDQGTLAKTVDQTVRVGLTDYNDNSPTFSSNVYSLSIPETQSTGSVFTLTVSDDDQSSTLTYAIDPSSTPSSYSTHFELDAGTANQVNLKAVINLDPTDSHDSSYSLIITVKDGGTPELTGTTTVAVTVTSVNNMTPTFAPTTYTTSISETATVGDSVYTMAANDTDEGNDGIISYSIKGGNTNNKFNIDSSSGVVRIASLLDFEDLAQYELLVEAKDGGSSPLSSTGTLTVDVTDVSDELPSCTTNAYTSLITEPGVVNTVTLVSLACSDKDAVDTLTYSISSGNGAGKFDIDGAGAITLASTVDYDSATQSYALTIQISDGTNTLEIPVNVQVDPLNEHTPAFGSDLDVSFSETTTVGTTIATHVASDADFSPHGVQEYQISSVTNSGSSLFSIDKTSGVIKLAQSFDYESITIKSYLITVIAIDGGSLTGTGTVSVTVTDENDVTPTCSPASHVISLAENTAPSTNVIADLGCTDADSGSLTYTIASQSPSADFSLDTTGTPKLVLSNALDYETSNSYDITVSVSDSLLSTTINIDISVTDINDGGPSFTQGSYSVSIAENTAVGLAIIAVTATDPDSTTSSFGKLAYSFISGNADSKFLINPSSGAVSTAGVLNTEALGSYSLVIEAIEEAGTNSATVTLAVTVTSVNDNAPVCSSGLTFSTSLAEEGTVGDTLYTLTCTDADGDSLTYTMTTGDTTYFQMNSNVLELIAAIDYDTVASSQFSIVIEVSDGTNTVDVSGSVTVTAVNEHSPAFASATAAVSKAEGTSPGSVITTVTVTDSDKDDTITYSFTTATTDFTIDQSTGQILLAGTLDRENIDSYTLTVQGSDGTNTDQYVLTLTVTDINDNKPVFNPLTYSQTLLESATTGAAVVNVAASDGDDPVTNNYGTISFSISSGNTGSLFTIGSTTGAITTTGALDYETTTSYTLIVQAIDSNSGAGAKSSTAVVTVTIGPVNEATPSFSNTVYTTSIREDTSIGQSVLKVTATDTDSGDDGVITFSMATNTFFYLDTENGDISVKASLDFESGTTAHTFDVVATDGGGGSALSSTTAVTITLTDYNDNSPTCSPNLQTVSFAENTVLTTNLATLTCTDLDSGTNADRTYSIQSVTPSVNIFEVTGGGQVNLINTLFDYETQTSYSILIDVTDGGTPQLTTTATIKVDVTDVNEANPAFTTVNFTFSVSETVSVGTSVFSVAATDADTANTIAYSLNPASTVFDIDITSGIIYTTATIDYDTLAAPKEYELTVYATDNGVGSLSATVTVTATVLDNNDGTPFFSPGVYSVQLAEDTVQGATITTVTATDIDDATVTYSLQSTFGILRIDPTGDIILNTASQDYETTKFYTVVVYAADANSNTGTATVHIEVTGVNEHDPVLTSASSTNNLAENSAIGVLIVTVTASDADDGMDGTITFSLSSIPAGYDGDFAINPTSGAITVAGTLDRETVTNPLTIKAMATDSGTAARSAEFTLTLTITDENDNTPSCSPSLYSISIAEDIAATTSVAQLTCTDSDAENPNNVLAYSILSGNTGNQFTIAASGEISTSNTAALDRETLPNYQLVIEVADTAGSSLTSSTTLTITVTDINDNNPSFSTSYIFTQDEDISIGTIIGSVTATDSDIDNAASLVYSIFSGNTDLNLAIDSNTGDIRLIGALDYENNPQYQLIVYAIDKEATFRTGSTTVTIDVIDKNDVTPSCSNALQTVQFAENTLTTTVTIATVTCSDSDTGVSGSVSYAISTVDGVATPSPFNIDSNTGVITLTTNLDYESDTLKQIIVHAIDGGTPALTGTATVNVAVTDINEADPVFTSTRYEVNVAETTAVGQSIYVVSASDTDTSNTITYSFSVASTVFEIDPSTGEVYLRETLDFETGPTPHTLIVVATDDGTSLAIRSATETLTITVTDVNDGVPVFNPAVYVGSISENDPTGSTVTTVTATDAEGSTMTYSVTLGNTDAVFRVEASGVIAIDSVANLDYDSATQSYTLVVEATDGTNTGTTTVAVAVTNYNDNTPVLMSTSSTQTLAEDTAVGMAVVTVDADDADFGTDGVITYTIASGNDAGKFAINPSSGAVTLAATLDMETAIAYTLNIDATDGGTNPSALSAQYVLTVAVTDVNDVTPVCTSSYYSVTLAENSAALTSVAQLTCSDSDRSSPNNDISQYVINSGNTGGDFSVTGTGEVQVVNAPDRETIDAYTLVLHIIDGGMPALTTTSTVAVLIADLNDNSPSFTMDPYSMTADEDTAVSTVIGKVTATDLDSGSAGTITYTLNSGNVDNKFVLDSSTGDLKLIASLDFETATNNPYVLEILGIDNDGTSPRTSSTTVSLSVNDKNDNTPSCTPAVQAVEFGEDTAGSTTMASITCTDTDSGVNADLTYEIVTVNGAVSTLFEVDASGVLTTAVATTFDYETTPSYAVLIRTKDGGTPSLSFTSTVNVVITDVNENAPVFQSTSFSTNVPETTVVGTSVYAVTADDADTANTVIYTINPSNTYFEIDSSTGIVYTIAAIDYDTITPKTISLTIVATDNGTPSQSVTETLNVTVTDSNDVTPVFNPAFYSGSVAEDQPVGTTVVTVTATDVDDPTLTYSIASGNGDNVFRVDPYAGEIKIDDVTNFDYDSVTKSYILIIRAVDAAPNTASTTVVIEVTNINDNAPTLASSSSTQTIAENTATGVTVIDIVASDLDHGVDGVITYTIASVTNSGSSKFSVDPTTGIVTVSGNIDRESVASYVLSIEAVDGATVPQTAIYTLTVTITDENDNTPSCNQNVYSASVSESATATTSVAQVTCSDSDATPPNNDISTYSIINGNTGSAFAVSGSGEITVSAALDRETLDNYQLVIEVIDSGTIALTTSTTVTITVTDENDNTAIFATTPYNFNPAESISIGTVVGTVGATDLDTGNNGAITFSIASGNVDSKFQIDSSTGDITTIAALDFETATVNPYTLVLNAVDSSGTPQTGIASAIITLTDVNDNTPVCTPVLQTVTNAEDTTTPTTLVTLVCNDADTGPNQDLTYIITSVNGVGTTTLFSIDTSGAIRLTNALDYETVTLHAIIAEVSDGGTTMLTTTVTVNVQVSDVNDNTPIFTNLPYLTNVIETTAVGTSVFKVTADDADTTNSITFSVNPLSANFDVDPSTGEVFLKAAVDFDSIPTQYEVIVVATDDGTNPSASSSSATVTLDITNFNDGTPEFNPGFYAISVREDTTAATSVLTVTITDIDDTTFTYSINSGNGDNIFDIAGTTTTAVLSVTDPTNLDYETTQAYSLVIGVSDSGGNTGTATIEITITNYNEHTPSLAASSSTPSIPENSAIGTSVADVDATDADSGTDGDVAYSIISGSSGKFAIDPSSGLLTVSGVFDKETLDSYTVVIHATDAGVNPGALTATFSAVVTITDVNDFSPVCSSSLYSASFAEDSAIGTTVTQLTCTDADDDSPNKDIAAYTITSGNTGGKFLISNTGEITTTVTFDRETTDNYELVIQVTDSGTTPSALSTSTTLTISITDVNDNAPVFGMMIYNINTDESTAVHTSIGNVAATDSDIGLAGSVLFSIFSGNPAGKFALDKTTGVVTLVGDLDYESTTTTPYVLVVHAIDREATFRTGTATVSITVNDVNDNEPTCTASLYTGTVAEDAAISTSVVTVDCSDEDTVGSALTYSITSSSPEFSIATATSGEITLASTLDYETATSHDLTIQVTDGTFPVSTSVKVAVTNVNDVAPVFSPTGPYTVAINENLSIGTTVYDVDATDADAAGTSFIFTITSGNGDSKFQIGTSTGILQIQQSIDRDNPLTTSYTLGIEVADQSAAGALTATTSIVITISDLNDNYPACDASEYFTTLPEDTTTASIITPTCTDLDVSASPNLLYTITAGNTGGKFQINTGTGVLSRVASLDYETATEYTLTVTVDDQGTSALLTTVVMTVYVDPVNENNPVFTGEPYDTAIDENVVNGYTVASISATDADMGSTHGTVRYSITGGNNAGHFALNPSTGALTVASTLDRESVSSYTLTVAAMDMISSDAAARTVSDTFTITINDVNDNYPKINPASYSAQLNEHVSGTLTSVLQIMATDDDEGNAGSAGLTYSITNGNTLNVFQMNTNTLELNGNVDANTQSIYTLTIKVADQGIPVLSAFTTVSVEIVATNDHAPTFTTVDDTVTISESEIIGSSIHQVASTDSDTGTFAILRYYLRSGVTTGSAEFTVDRFDGTVRVATKLDYDTTPIVYTLKIEVEDTENSEANTQTATATLTVSLTDYNDETPTCTSNTFTGDIDENSVTGTSVLTVNAIDGDTSTNGQVAYSIVGGSGSSIFAIDSSTGVITSTTSIDYESTALYDLEIKVNDGGTPTLSSSCLARITINDMNDNTPVLLATSFAISLSESIAIGTTVDTVQATDADSTANNNNVIAFSLSTPSGHFSIGGSTGILTTTALLDRETATSHTLIIYAADQGTVGPNTASTTYTIYVSDENDNDPVNTNTYDTIVNEDTAINTVVHTLTVTDADDGANKVLTYVITNGNTDTDFRIDSGSGLIQIINSLDRERTALYNLQVTVTDGGTPSRMIILTATVSVGDINDNNPIFQPNPTTVYMFNISENVPTGTVVDSVSANDADTGSNAAITYDVVSYVTGDSSHFSLNSATGEITTAGSLDRETQDTYEFIVRAQDGGSNTLMATATVSITILDANDNVPSFGSTLYTATVVENSAADTSILSVVFSDLDTLVNDDIVLSIDTSTTDGARADLFVYANSTTSALYVKLPMDRETDEYFNFTLIATDQGTPPLSFSTSVVITVGDENDNAPIFSPTFYNSEIAYNDECQVTVATITATDADSGVNAVIAYYTTLNNSPHLFSLSSSTGVMSMVANAASDTGYIMYAAARDSGSPQQTSSIGAIIRVDTYNPNVVVLNYYMDISETSYLAIESAFLSQLTTLYQVTYPTAQAKRWCVAVISSSSCAVRIYVIEDDTADAESEIANTKNFLSASAAYSITAADDAGTPASSITGVSWTQFAISRVEKYADPDSSDSKPWVQTTAGIAVLTVTGIIGALLIGGIIAYAIWYCRKPPTPPPRNRVEIGDDDGGDTVAKNKFDTRNNTMMTPNTSLLPYDKKQLPPAVVALPMPSATRRVPMQTGNKSIDKPKDINIFNASSQKPIFEKKPEKLRRSSPVPTETAYSPSSRFRTNSPFTQSEINYPSKRIPPMQRMPAQKPPRLDDSESTVPDYRSNLDESEYTGPKGKFDGRAVDPVSRRVYEYSTKTNERRWVTEPDGSLGKPVKLTRDDS